jgi:hypothetical protein
MTKGRLNVYRIGLILAVLGIVGYLLKFNHLRFQDLVTALPYLLLYLLIKLGILLELTSMMSTSAQGRRSALTLKKVLCVELVVGGASAAIIFGIWVLFQIPQLL